MGARGASALPFAHAVRKLDDRVLAFAEDEGVDEPGHRLGVEGAAAPGNDERMLLRAVGGKERDAAQVQHVEDVRVGQLVLEGEAEDIEFVQRTAILQAPEKRALFAQLRLHVLPWGIGAFGEDIGDLVEDVVEDTDAHVGHADVVGVRVSEGEADGHVVPGFGDAVPFAAGIASGLGDAREQLFRCGGHGEHPLWRANGARCQGSMIAGEEALGDLDGWASAGGFGGSVGDGTVGR